MGSVQTGSELNSRFCSRLQSFPLVLWGNKRKAMKNGQKNKKKQRKAGKAKKNEKKKKWRIPLTPSTPTPLRSSQKNPRNSRNFMEQFFGKFQSDDSGKKKPINIKTFGGWTCPICPVICPVCPADILPLECEFPHKSAQTSRVSLGRPEFIPGTLPGHSDHQIPLCDISLSVFCSP